MKRILITGITGNLGRAAAKYFGDEGWEVDGVSRSASLLHPAARGIKGVQMNSVFPVDLANWTETENYIQSRESEYDIVFMTHGTQQKVLISEFNWGNFEDIIGNNLNSAAILSMALMRYDKLNPSALVVYCSSIQASQPRAGRGLYAIAKSGLEALTRTMAVELAPEGRAIALRLGQMESTMKGITFTPEDEKAIREYTPLPWVSFEDTARLVLNLYAQPSISGEVIEISSLHKFGIWPK
jgi:NAD(P)-dependent dehydrogenase (short-subunit alcohol dehydrogenase family)